jgi:DMSO/TMAO reductase YedYZ molybdopterin-dependent catalytic subunit
VIQKKSTIILILLVVLAAAVVAGCTSSPTATPSVAGTSAGLLDSSDYQIVLTGGNLSPVTLTYADLKAMKMAEMSNTTMVKMNGVRITSDWKGILLDDILAKAGLPAGNLTMKMYAPDGFDQLYTMDQLQGAMLGLTKNGTALDTNVEGDNAIQLVIAEHIGHEWIKVPTRIEINKA